MGDKQDSELTFEVAVFSRIPVKYKDKAELVRPIRVSSNLTYTINGNGRDNYDAIEGLVRADLERKVGQLLKGQDAKFVILEDPEFDVMNISPANLSNQTAGDGPTQPGAIELRIYARANGELYKLKKQ
ncbi:hypothetical protein HYT57_01565 [Candidatus Woesearchaeota archaeon]|nr:hypothetical protein [Candidatus Woesearchaeota archaeon]